MLTIKQALKAFILSIALAIFFNPATFAATVNTILPNKMLQQAYIKETYAFHQFSAFNKKPNNLNIKSLLRKHYGNIRILAKSFRYYNVPLPQNIDTSKVIPVNNTRQMCDIGFKIEAQLVKFYSQAITQIKRNPNVKHSNRIVVLFQNLDKNVDFEHSMFFKRCIAKN